mmetsp:Transcript_115026/g.229005  ORF Transcript_115026/g.229005 Transcript_115026/m.229005 type:complete len:381 (+) Transcript_115026:61-1203(+)
MTTPDILETVGFEKRKVGARDTELGYVIKKKSLNGLVIGVAAVFGVLAVVAIFTQFEVRVEKRSFQRKLRKEEHHAASKLAQVDMELWAQYQEDIRESNEAQTMVRRLNESYDKFRVSLNKTIEAQVKEIHLNSAKAAHLADVILQQVANLRTNNMHHVKHLVDHLVTSGKRSGVLEKHVSKSLKEDLLEESKQLHEDKEAGIDAHERLGSADSVGDTSNASSKDDPLKGVLEGFFWTFNDYEAEFKHRARTVLSQPGNAVYRQLQDLWANITSATPPSEDEVGAALDHIDLASVGAGLGSGRVLPAVDIVEELLLIPKIPHRDIEKLQEVWQSGQTDSVDVLAKLELWYADKLIPSGWLKKGVEREEQALASNERSVTS